MGGRRKGEQPVAQPLQRWTDDHPVARCIKDGDHWFDAWVKQMATPYVRLAKITGIPVARLVAINRGDNLSRAELDALAKAWSISSGDLLVSLPERTVIVT